MPDETHLKNWAAALTNEILAAHLVSVATNVRFFDPAGREALLREAARRLAIDPTT